MMSRPTLSAAIGTLALVALLGLAGCGSSSPTPSASPSSSSTMSSSTPSAPGYCAQAQSLRASLDTLRNVDVATDGVDALRSALADVKTDLDATATAAAAELKPQLDQVRTALDAVQTAADGLSTDNVLQKAPGIVDALRQLGTATDALTTAVTQRCPSSP